MNVARLLFVFTAAALAGCAHDAESGPGDVSRDDGGSGTDAGADTGGGSGADAGPVPVETEYDDNGWPIPYPADNVLPPTDPRYDGQAQFLYDTWGSEVLGQWPPADFVVGLQFSEPEVFGDQFSRFGFIPDPNRDLPVGLARGRDNPDQMHETCAACHVATLPDGRVWLGAPASNLDYMAFRSAVDERWVAAGNPSLFEADSGARALEYGRGRMAAESSEYALPVPADFPVYYNLGGRTALNHLGTGRNVRTEAFFSIFTFGAGDPNDDEAIVPFPTEEYVTPFLEFFGSIEAPVGPARDAALVARGAEVFAEARCSSCHHPDDPAADGITPVDRAADGLERIPGDDPDWPRGSIRTSFAHRVLIDGDGSEGSGAVSDEGRLDLINFIITRRLSVQNSDGYRVAYLSALWSSAPYLHNGSVPTLEDLLKPASERPVTFAHNGFTFDTTLDWNTNRGHEFGTSLSDADKSALIEYLLSL